VPPLNPGRELLNAIDTLIRQKTAGGNLHIDFFPSCANEKLTLFIY
jgi:hypothetical protein